MLDVSSSENVSELKQDIKALSKKNDKLQNELSPYFGKKSVEAKDEDDDAIKLYTSSVQSYLSSKVAFLDVKDTIEAELRKFEAIKIRMAKEAAEVCDKLNYFLKEISLNAVDSLSGKQISEKKVLKLLKVHKDKETRYHELLHANLVLEEKLKRLNKEFKSKQQVKGGLHLIDFEQLKIENQGLSEKIESRDDEASKLLNKTTELVQIQSHVDKRITYLKGDNAQRSSILSELNKNVLSKKERVLALKKKQNMLKQQKEELVKRSSLACNQSLLDDYKRIEIQTESTFAQVQVLKDRLAAIRARKESLRSD